MKLLELGSFVFGQPVELSIYEHHQIGGSYDWPDGRDDPTKSILSYNQN